MQRDVDLLLDIANAKQVLLMSFIYVGLRFVAITSTTQIYHSSFIQLNRLVCFNNPK